MNMYSNSTHGNNPNVHTVTIRGDEPLCADCLLGRIKGVRTSSETEATS